MGKRGRNATIESHIDRKAVFVCQSMCILFGKLKSVEHFLAGVNTEFSIDVVHASVRSAVRYSELLRSPNDQENARTLWQQEPDLALSGNPLPCLHRHKDT